MRIIQIVPSLAYGDAIGNDVLALDSAIKRRDFSAKIYAEGVDPRFSSDLAQNIKNYVPEKDDLVILHVGAAARTNEWIKTLSCKKIMVYHNITPASFFSGYNKVCEHYNDEGIRQLKELKDTFDMVLAVSDFNKQDLIDMGYKCEINVLPIVIPFDDYKKEPSQSVLRKYDDDYTNVLFLGRIAPNKKHEDVIQAFDFYQKNYNAKSRLFLVGNPKGCENYCEQLREFTKRLGTKNVVFTGHTKFDEILAYYTLSDLFLCMSEHEGFCVPLVESMYFNIPILAYASSAIPCTLGGSGFLLKDKNPAVAGSLINKILTDAELKNVILRNQQERLSDFDDKKIESLFWSYIQKFIKN